MDHSWYCESIHKTCGSVLQPSQKDPVCSGIPWAPRLMISVEQFHELQRIWVFLLQFFWTSRLQVSYCLNFPLLGFVWTEKHVLTVILQKYTSQNLNLFLLPSYTYAKGLAECLGQCLTWSLYIAMWFEMAFNVKGIVCVECVLGS